MRRREFFGVVATAAAWPFAASAQQGRMRRVAVLAPFNENDPAGQVFLAAFKQRLIELGWTEGRNLAIDYRFTGGIPENVRVAAGELVGTTPDVIFASSNVSVGPLLQATKTIPIIFTQVSDPVGSGFIASLARPDGNLTGFQGYERVARGQGYQLGASVVQIGVEADEQELGPPACKCVEGLIDLVARALPAVFSNRDFTEIGGLMSYGTNIVDAYRQVGVYAGRILKGAKPADLPVVQAAKFELVINLPTARMLGISVPPSLLARVDEVIE